MPKSLKFIQFIIQKVDQNASYNFFTNLQYLVITYYNLLSKLYLGPTLLISTTLRTETKNSIGQ